MITAAPPPTADLAGHRRGSEVAFFPSVEGHAGAVAFGEVELVDDGALAFFIAARWRATNRSWRCLDSFESTPVTPSMIIIMP